MNESNFRQRSRFPQPSPPPRRRHHHQRPSSSSSTRRKETTRNQTTSTKQQLYVLLSTLIGLAIWYLTPVSNYAVEFMLLQVPIDADIELGKQAIHYQQQQQHQQQENSQFNTLEVFDNYWTPKLQSIGWDLVEASQERNTKLYQWDFSILNDDTTVNAFALPGGGDTGYPRVVERIKTYRRRVGCIGWT